MPPLGTAPHRVSPGVWVTLGGRALTPAGSMYWEHFFRTGHTDGRGHLTTPSVMFAPPPTPKYAPGAMRNPPTPTARPGQKTTKPSFATAVAARKGNPAARTQINRYQLHIQAQRQQAAQQNALISGQFGGFEQLAARANKTISPIGEAIVKGLSPVEAAKSAYHETRQGNLGMAALDAAAIFPFGRGAKAFQVAREAEAAAAAAKAAGEAAPASHIMDALGAAKEARVSQDALASAERGRRIKASDQAFHEAGGGLAGHYASLEKLRGELPKARFDDLTGLSDSDMKKLMNIVHDNPALSEWESLSLRAGLVRARSGLVPRDFEIALMRKAFGVSTATEFANPSWGQHALRTVADVANIPRAIMSSADVSAVLRQSLVATMHRPGVAAKNIGPMFKMAFSGKFYDEAMGAIERDPQFWKAVNEDGLKMTDVHGPMGTREEAYPSQIAEKIPVAGHLIRGSNRAYTGFINLMRWHVYSELLGMSETAGKLTPETRRNAAKVANWATGRGDLPGKTLEAAAPLLNTAFFSPRLMASRFQTFNPFFYANLDPIARKYAMTAAIKTVMAGTAVLGAAAAAGAKVNLDPTNADFGKIKVGNTRIDVWGGHQQWVRVAAQLAEGKITSSTTGKTIRLSGGFTGSSRWDVASRFLQGKFSPSASLIRDWSHHSDFQGKPFSWKKAVVSRVYPLIVQDMLDTYHQYGLGPAAGIYGVGAFGIGVQTYGKTPTSGAGPSQTPSAGADPFAGWGKETPAFTPQAGANDPFANWGK